jgi:hypothetical protein
MKTISNKSSGFTGVLAGALLGLGLLAVTIPNPAAANTAATNIIRNTATVNYADAGGTAQTAITASVDIKVLLVRSAVNYPATPPADQATVGGSPVTYNYTITATANGLDTYTLSTNITESAGISGSTALVNGGTLSVDLGATTYVSHVDAAGKSTITVPSDDASNGVVNGLQANDWVVIGGNLYQVDSVDDSNGGNPGTSTITLKTVLTTAPAVGDVIGEQYAFTVVVTPGNVTDATVNQTIDVELVTTAGTATKSDTTRTTVTAVSLTPTKYVRNATAGAHGVTGNSGGVGATVINGATYYTSGVTGEPSDILEYVIAVANAPAGSPATKVIISDPIQRFTSYVPGSMRVDPTGAGWSAALTDTQADTDAGEADLTAGAQKVYIFAGTGGAGDNDGVFGSGNGGSLAAGVTTYGLFRVTID